ncbi:MAG TPA: hypothetical protein DCY84_02625 [Firmicutes bacterium]|nr:hypothetical protein [Bacillota bacterium]
MPKAEVSVFRVRDYTSKTRVEVNHYEETCCLAQGAVLLCIITIHNDQAFPALGSFFAANP